ncbi:hypothetical protein KCP71_09135 [Salmonella enterica subsp. enterica]|nr:hypothetical protein KCP71_09135 [Salmonella enterica subsp. enterica]
MASMVRRYPAKRPFDLSFRRSMVLKVVKSIVALNSHPANVRQPPSNLVCGLQRIWFLCQCEPACGIIHHAGLRLPNALLVQAVSLMCKGSRRCCLTHKCQ